MAQRFNFNLHIVSPRLGVYLLLMTPLVFWNTLFFGYASSKTLWIVAAVELTMLAYVWFIYWRPSLRPKWSWQIGVLYAYIAVLVISTVFGVYPANSFWSGFERNEGLLVWLHLAAIFPVFLSFFKTKKDWLSLAVVTCGVGIVVSSIYFLISLSIYTPTISDNGGATLGNSSYLGVYLLFQIFFSGFLLLEGKARLIRAFGAISFVVFVFTLVMTDARASTIAFFGGAVLFVALVLLVEKGRMFKRIFGWILMTALVAGFAFTVVSIFRPDSGVRQKVIELATGSRFVVADISWKAFLDRPLLGWGPENFHFAFLTHYNPCFGNNYCGGNTLFDRAHNIILDTLVQTGVLGLLGYLGLYVTAVSSSWLSVRHRGIDARLAALLTATLAAYFVQDLTFFDISIALLFLVIFLAFSTSLLSGDYKEDDHRPVKEEPSGPMLPTLGSFLLPVAFLFFVILPLRADLAVFPATTETNSVVRATAVQHALWTSPFGRDVRRAYLGFNTANLLWSYDPEKDTKKLAPQAVYLKQEAEAIEAALYDTLKRSPNEFRAQLYLMWLLQAHARLFDASKFDEALSVVDEAIERTPKSPRLRWVKTSLFLETGRIDEAKEAAGIALELNNDAGRSQFNKFLFATYVGDMQMQTDAIAVLEAGYPKFAGLIPEVLGYDREVRKYAFFNDFYSE